MRSSVRKVRPGLVAVAVGMVGAFVALPSAPGSAKVVRDYKVTATPAQVTVNAGQSAATRVRVVRTGRYSNAVTLRASGMPAGVSAGFRRAGTDQFDLVFTAAASAPSGSACISVVGRAADRTRNTCMSLQVVGAPPAVPVTTTTLPPPPPTAPATTTTTTPRPAPDFLVAASSAPQSVYPGNSVTWPVAIIPVNGFNSAVNFAVVSALPPGATAVFSPVSSFGPSTLTIVTATTTPPGSYPITIRATGGPGSRDAAIVLVVSAVADFTLAANPAVLTLQPGGIGVFNIDSTSVAGAAVGVTYTIAGLPAGASATLSATSSLGTTMMTIALVASTPSGIYPLTLTGQSGSFTRTLPLTLNVGGGTGYGLTLSPPSQTVTRGASTTFQVNVVAQSAFSGPVTLTVTGLPSGVTGVLSLNPVTLTGGQTLASTLTLTAAAGAQTGLATVTVTGTAAGGLSASVSVPLTVV